ncbi:MAG: L,D-transpeptidase [Oligoflexia bacterium]|nr:L,D-transpeptidase [Oligoflexia bacterium]
MKRQLLTFVGIGICLAGLASAAQNSSEAESVPFNFGDLSSFDEAFSSDSLGQETRMSPFSRAQTQAQLANHTSRRVQIFVHKSMKERGYQYLQVFVDGALEYDAPTSTAWERFAKAKTRSYQAYTPVGKFVPDGMEPRRFSNTWQVWLKYVIRFSGGIWIHATTPDHYLELGSPASGGCVRLHPNDASVVYDIVSRFGMDETAITVIPAQAGETQVPWKLQSRKVPDVVTSWRALNGF